jgi:imidazolonepropionase-like amidohydrolase
MRTSKKLVYALGALLATAAFAILALYVAYDATLFKPQQDVRRDIVIRNGALFDGTSTQARPNPGLVLREGVIECIGGQCTVPEGALEIDATGLAILPGFIDLHRHFFGSRENVGIVATIWDIARMMPDKRRELLEAGVTSIRQLGDPRDAILEVKRMLAARELAGPRLFVAGPIVTAPGGHPAYGGRDPNPSGVGGLFTFQSDDPAAVRAEIAVLAAQGVDGIKAVLHGSVSEDGQRVLPTLSDATFEALVAEAKAHELWVAVHVGPAHQAAQAARAGVTTVEHGIRSGNRVDAATVRALVDNRVIYVATLGHEPDGHLAIPALHAAGVLFGVGTDEDDYHAELARLAAAGIPAAEVLVAATRTGAAALQRERDLGTLEEGKLADVVLVRGAPWANITDARNVVTVIQDGYLIVDRRSSRTLN